MIGELRSILYRVLMRESHVGAAAVSSVALDGESGIVVELADGSVYFVDVSVGEYDGGSDDEDDEDDDEDDDLDPDDDYY